MELTVKIERAVRGHPSYWETRLLLAAKNYDVYDRVVYSSDSTDGYVIFACLKVGKVEYHVLHFRYNGPNAFGFISVSFTAPYLVETSPELVLKKPNTDREDNKDEYDPPPEGMQP